jgi:predicted enzyme related to lactoylglutathione lyase
MSKNNHIDLIEFPASSPDELTKLKGFFTNVFGWQYKDYGGGYSDTADSGVTLGINATGDGQSNMPLTVLYVEDLEATKEKVVQADGTILVDIYSFPGGRRFHFTDPAGHELAVWSE